MFDKNDDFIRIEEEKHDQRRIDASIDQTQQNFFVFLLGARRDEFERRFSTELIAFGLFGVDVHNEQPIDARTYAQFGSTSVDLFPEQVSLRLVEFVDFPRLARSSGLRADSIRRSSRSNGQLSAVLLFDLEFVDESPSRTAVALFLFVQIVSSRFSSVVWLCSVFVCSSIV